MIPSALGDLSDEVSCWGYLNCQLNCPKTWSAAKRGARPQGFDLCAAGFVCFGYLAIPIPHYSWTVESQVSMVILDWRFYQMVCDQDKNKVFIYNLIFTLSLLCYFWNIVKYK